MNGYVKKFYEENKDMVGTKRQASKYLHGFGNVYKKTVGIPVEYTKRAPFKEPTLTPKSKKNTKKG